MIRKSFSLLCLFRRSQSGAAAVEFAIIGSVFITSLLGLFEFGRIMWMHQAIADAAHHSARCATTEIGQCTSQTTVESFAVAEGKRLGVSIMASDVTAQLDVMCNSYQANRVDITYQVNSPVRGLVPFVPETLGVSACYPVAS